MGASPYFSRFYSRASLLIGCGASVYVSGMLVAYYTSMNTHEHKGNAMYSREEQQQIATTILNQIGRRELFSLQASKYVALTEGGVQFSVKTPRTSRINKLVIRLTAMDDYTIEYWNLKRGTFEPTLIKTTDGIYCDMLSEACVEGSGVEVINL